ncbi:MAG: CRISPR system precrRNA processing endoribonuclease RAMP protein Cas6 [Anaerolineae bacterium]
MEGFTAHRLTIDCEGLSPVLLREHKGAALRGALYQTLRARFCTVQEAESCAACPLWQVCPVCTLVSTLAPENRLGRDAARPYTIQPPLDGGKGLYAAGETFRFGLTLYADAMRLFPYVVMALRGLEDAGLGRRGEENGWRRGALRLRQAWVEHPLTGERREVLRPGEARVSVPDLPLTHAEVCRYVETLPPEGLVRVDFLTPTRLTARGQLVKPGELRFETLLGRLFDRIESLARSFAGTAPVVDYRGLMVLAQGVETVEDATQWIDLASYSARQGRCTPIGGLVGSVLFRCGDWRPFYPWLAWGQFTHVGKDAVKGNGWYRMAPERGEEGRHGGRHSGTHH